MRTKHRLAGLCAAILLGACGGAQDGNRDDMVEHGSVVDSSPQTGSDTQRVTAACHSWLGGGSAAVDYSVATACVDCAVSDVEHATDTDAQTFAAVHIGAGVGISYEPVVTVTGKAQEGVVFPAGSTPGGIVRLVEPGAIEMAYLLRTYLAGSLQEEFYVGNGLIVGSTENTQPKFLSAEATRPFDAVEFGFGVEGNSISQGEAGSLSYDIRVGAGGYDAQLYELCAD